MKSNAITNKGTSFTARGKILLQPTDNFSVIVTAAHAEFDDPTGAIGQNLQPAAIFAVFTPGSPISKDRFHTTAATKQFIRTETNEYSVRAKLELEAGTLSSFTAFVRQKLDGLSDLTGTYLPVNVALQVRSRTFTQEVNFASPADKPLAYVVGVFYYKANSRTPFVTQGGALGTTRITNAKSNGDAIAGYADGTYTFGDLSLIAGIRYTHEKRHTLSAPGFSAPSLFTRDQRATENVWTPRLGLRYALGERTNVYATYSKGFKSGAFDATSNGPGVVPEKLDAFEVGFKHASRAFSFNAAAFYYDYTNTQVNTTVVGAGGPGSIQTQLRNVPKSRIYGVEADATLRLGDNFDLRAAVAYTHARYINFPTAPGYRLNPADPATLGGLIFSNFIVNASGNTMVRSPEFTASSTLAYHTPIGDNNEFEITLSPYYSSRVYFTFDNSQSQKAYVTLDGAATLTLDKNLKISIFGRNLTDSKHFTSMSQNAFSLQAVKFATPRTYGVSLGYSF